MKYLDFFLKKKFLLEFHWLKYRRVPPKNFFILVFILWVPVNHPVILDSTTVHQEFSIDKNE